MTFTPVSSFSPSPIGEVSGLALAMHVGPQRETFLLTGGEAGKVIRLSGPYEGTAFDIENAGKAAGLIFQDVEFEVDLGSRFDANQLNQPLGGLVLHEGGIEIIAKSRSQMGFDEARRFLIDGSKKRPPDRMETAFSSWRVVQRRGSEKAELFVYSAHLYAEA